MCADILFRFRYKHLNNDEFMTAEEKPQLNEKVLEGHDNVHVPETISEEASPGPKGEKDAERM